MQERNIHLFLDRMDCVYLGQKVSHDLRYDYMEYDVLFFSMVNLLYVFLHGDKVVNVLIYHCVRGRAMTIGA